MKKINIKAGKNKYIVEAEVIICGDDLNVCICGGETYHIGASALALPRKSLTNEEVNSSSASVLSVLGHKDDELARLAALELSALFQCRVNAVVGIHIDDATKEDIQALMENFNLVLNKIKDKIITL